MESEKLPSGISSTGPTKGAPRPDWFINDGFDKVASISILLSSGKFYFLEFAHKGQMLPENLLLCGFNGAERTYFVAYLEDGEKKISAISEDDAKSIAKSLNGLTYMEAPLYRLNRDGVVVRTEPSDDVNKARKMAAIAPYIRPTRGAKGTP